MIKQSLFIVTLFVILMGCATTGETGAPTAKENLMDLIENQNLDKIREIFGFNTDANSANELGQTALHIAAGKDLAEIAAVLLVRGAKVDARDKEGKTPLHYALREKALGVISILIKNGAGLFVKDNAGRHPLHEALQGSLDTLKLLVGAENAGTRDENGNTPLHYAAEAGKLNETEYLISLKAPVADRNLLGETALDVALKQTASLPHAKVARILLKNGSPTPKEKAFDYLPKIADGNLSMGYELGSTALHFAAGRGHRGWCELLLQEGAPVNAQDLPGNTPLHRAVENGFLDIAELLIRSKADVNARDFNNNTAIHLALTSRKPQETLGLLLGNGADPNGKNNFGNTALHLVVTLNLPTELLSILIARSADPNSRNKLGNSPLMEAVRAKKKEESRLLLQAGASLFATNNEDRSPLTEAIFQGIETFRWLVGPESVALRDDNGNTPLHVAVRVGDHPAVVSYLLASGAMINDRNKNGNTPLLLAIDRESVEICQLLLQSGADIYTLNNDAVSALAALFQKKLAFVDQVITSDLLEKTDSSQNTPLFHAVFSDSLPITDLLLKKGAKIQAKNLLGSTPLHEAVRQGSLSLVEFLIKNGAKLGEIDNLGNTTLHNVVFGGSQEIGDLLLSSVDPAGGLILLNYRNKEGRSPLHEAVRRGEIRMAGYFLAKRASLLTQDNNGRTPLFDAVMLDSLEMSELLIAGGAKVMVRDASGNTPLHMAVSGRAKGLNELLIANGADLFAENRLGETPISMALGNGIEAARLLLNKKNIGTQNNQGNTPLHLAVLGAKDESVLAYLLGLGPDVNPRNKNGRTPLDLALESKKSAFAELLLKAGAIR